MGEASQAIVTFAIAAIPGVLVLEMIEYARPRVTERGGIRGLAVYLILSATVWGLAVLSPLQADGRLASVIDTANSSGEDRVTAYAALAWRLAVTAVAIGIALRIVLWIATRMALRIEKHRIEGTERLPRLLGNLVVSLVGSSFAWDALMLRLHDRAVPQIVHIRSRDGKEMYGALAAGGRADFQADGRGLVLDLEFLDQGGTLVPVTGSNGVFVPRTRSPASRSRISNPTGERANLGRWLRS